MQEIMTMCGERPEQTLLNPARPLAKEVAAWLLGRVKREEGAPSLAHVMVVVPTAQSGRNLRLELAREAGCVLPPKIVLPMQLVRSADETLKIATAGELRAAFLRFIADASASGTLGDYPHLFMRCDFRAQLAIFDQLQDIWRVLAGGGLTMADVPVHPQAQAVFQQALGEEQTRWQELALFEERFFGWLRAHGLRHQTEDIKLARTNPLAVPAAIEEVVLPMLADPVSALYDVLGHQRASLRVTVLKHCMPAEADRFDVWGRPIVSVWTTQMQGECAGLRDEDIVCTARDEELARQVAADFPPATDDRQRPSLGLCDAELFPELTAAFLNRGYVLHNPERHLLVRSSLGRMLLNLLALYAARKEALPWSPFVALLREDDVLAGGAGGANLPARELILAGIDACQNRFLPTVLASRADYDISAVHSRQQSAMSAFVVAAKVLLALLESAWAEAASPSAFLREAMRALFVSRALLGTDEEMEFRAATDAVREVLDAFDDEAPLLEGLDELAIIGLLRKELTEAAYSLEPSDRAAISTEGWLELAWSAADKIALVGFTEGCVPDSIVGHPFLPDNLRVALGLMSNAGRLARDTMLLADIIRARSAEPGSVRAYLAMTNAAGDQRHPSRLLYLVSPEKLAGRVSRLFGELSTGSVRKPRTPEPKWSLNLPLSNVPLPHVSPKEPLGHLSASAIDTWLRCPFTYLLKCGLEMEHVKEKRELEANDFGQLIHGVLEDYAREQIKRTADGLAQLTDEQDIAAAFVRLLANRRACFGPRLTLRVRLQFDAAEGRLLAFAPLQAKWAAEGWQIVEQPEYKFNVHPFAGELDVDLPFNGSIDRIDCKDGKYRIIDYKTWDKKNAAKKHVLGTDELQHEHALRLRLPEISAVVKNGTISCSRFLSIQLLLYARCLECADAKFAGNIVDCCYALLGRDAANVAVFGSCFDQGSFDVYKRACDRVKLLDHWEVALETVRTVIRRIRGNFFWPPGPTEDWKFDFRQLITASPERDLPPNTPWRDAQEEKLNELEVAQ